MEHKKQIPVLENQHAGTDAAGKVSKLFTAIEDQLTSR